MGYTVDKKTGKIILVHDVTVSSKAVKQPETQQQPQQRQQEAQQTAATLPVIPAASLSSARASAPGTFVFPVTRQKVRTVWHEGNVWFVANDVSACLGFARPEKAIIDHCNHAKTLKGPESGGLTFLPSRHQHHPRIRRLPPCHALQTSRRRTVPNVGVRGGLALYPQNGRLRRFTRTRHQTPNRRSAHP